MPIPGMPQPQHIQLTGEYRLHRYDGHYELALEGYQDPAVYENSEGIFDKDKIPDLEYVRWMFTYLDKNGELYFIEALENGEYVPVGDVTVKDENPPLAIGRGEYRGRGLGTLVMGAVIDRLRELGYTRIRNSTVYKWNESSLKMHQKLGFKVVRETEREYFLDLEL